MRDYSNFTIPPTIYTAVKASDRTTAKSFQTTIKAALEAAGYKVQKEYVVHDRGDGKTGAVDLVIYDADGLIGIELDNYNPRKKSLFKLQHNFKRWIVFCRA